MPAPELSIIIVNYNTSALLRACLDSVYARTRGVCFEVIVVDNASSDGSLQMLAEHFPQVRVLAQPDNLGFGRANNLGVAASTAPWLMLLNSDTVLLTDTAAALVDFLKNHPDAGVVGPQVLLLDGRPQPKTFGYLPTARRVLNQSLLLSRIFPHSEFFGGIFVEHARQECVATGWISGVCMVLRREAFQQAGGFDPAYFMYAEDIDLCRRLRQQQWKVYRWQAHALKHYCGGSSPSPERMLRNHVIHQRNSLRLWRASMRRPAYMLVRVLLGAGLGLRLLARGLAAAVGFRSQRHSFQAALYCLRDLVGLLPRLPGDRHAHRN